MSEKKLKQSYMVRPTYEVSTPIFEGPLALLLHLIEKKQLDITKVALAQVTDEFLAHVDVMRENLEIEKIADFLSMAARLLWMKSRALLPKPPESACLVVDEDDAGDELVRQLRAYRKFKEAAQWLRERNEIGLRTHLHVAPPVRPQNVNIDLSSLTLEKLLDAAQSALYPVDDLHPEDAIQRPRISIVHQIRLIRKRLTHLATTTYRNLLSREPTRVEAVVTLQAILELVKQRSVRAQQEQMFGDITVEPLVPPDQIREPEVDSTELSEPPQDQ